MAKDLSLFSHLEGEFGELLLKSLAFLF